MNDDYSKKPDVPNRKVNIAGMEVNVVSDKEFLKADHAIAMPKWWHDKAVAEHGYEIPGTKNGYPCKLCGQDCVLAPSGQMLEAQGLKYTCMECFMKIIKEQEKGN